MAQRRNNRLNRVEEELKRELSYLITHELKNPHVTGIVSVTKVKVTPDLKMAKVSISVLQTKKQKEILLNLKKSAGFLRTELAKRVNLRNTPELLFEWDDSIEYGAKIDTILKDIMKDIDQKEK